MPGRFLGYWYDSSLATYPNYNGQNWNNIPKQILNSFAIGVHVPGWWSQYVAYYTNGNMPYNPDDISSDYLRLGAMGWKCLDVIWKYKNGINSSNGFLMQTYINKELKMEKHYSSYLELGLPDNNVIWGISSADGGKNSYTKIQYINMKTGTNINTKLDFDIEINLVRTNWNLMPSLFPGFYEDETLFSEMNDCGGDGVDISKIDTITNKYFCLENYDIYTKYNRNYIEILGIDMSNALWYVNDTLVQDSTYYSTNTSSYLFLINDYIDMYTYDSEYVYIKAVINNDTINFKFKVSSVDKYQINAELYDFLEESDFDFTFKGDDVKINFDISEGFIFPIPNLTDCDFVVKADSFVAWTLEDGNIIFVPTEKCNLDFSIEYDCECVGMRTFNFSINSPTILNYFKQNSETLKVKVDGNNINRWLDDDTTFQSIPIPPELSNCLKISYEETLFSNPPKIENDNLIFELDAETKCEDINITLTDNCPVCIDADSVVLKFYKLDLSIKLPYATCSGAKLDITNCDNSNIPSIINCVYYKMENGVTSGTIKDGLITEAGDYKVICYNEITGQIIDSKEFKVNEGDLYFSLPKWRYFHIASNNVNDDLLRRCIYSIRLDVRVPIDTTSGNTFFDKYDYRFRICNLSKIF